MFALSTTCGICGKPIDMTLDGNHPDGPVVDHIDELVAGGDPLDPENLQPAHRRCNGAKEADRAHRARHALPPPRNPSRDW